jgi:sulfatase maturation enzyme AslB (radical SAM superfamily)
MPNQITWDEFEEQFKPIQNHLDNNASCNGWMFETYGAELDYVIEQTHKDPFKVWTVVDNDGLMSITDGYHIVNRMGYIITEVPFVHMTEVIDPEDIEHWEQEQAELEDEDE